MLLSPSANRAKSWACEHCPNWTKKDIVFCNSCFWAHPENYTHIAGKEERQIIVTFTDNEIEDYNKLIELVGQEKAEDTIKDLISKFIKKKEYSQVCLAVLYLYRAGSKNAKTTSGTVQPHMAQVAEVLPLICLETTKQKFLIHSIHEDTVSEEYRNCHPDINWMVAEDMIAFAPVLGLVIAI